MDLVIIMISKLVIVPNLVGRAHAIEQSIMRLSAQAIDSSVRSSAENGSISRTFRVNFLSIAHMAIREPIFSRQ